MNQSVCLVTANPGYAKMNFALGMYSRTNVLEFIRGMSEVMTGHALIAEAR